MDEAVQTCCQSCEDFNIFDTVWQKSLRLMRKKPEELYNCTTVFVLALHCAVLTPTAPWIYLCVWNMHRSSGNVFTFCCFHPDLFTKHMKSLGWKHGCCLAASISYLESDTGSILDLKWHFLPIQCDLSGVERSWGERTDRWMNGWMKGSIVGFL